MALPPLDPQQRRNLMLGALMVGLVGYGSYEYLLKPRGEAVTQLEAELVQLEATNRTARALNAGVAEDPEAQLARYREQLTTVETLIPSSEELPDLLDAISAEARATGVEISLIQPVGAEKEEYYTRRVYDMAVLGSYHRIGSFLTRVASLPRIVSPINLTLAPRAAGEQDEEDETRLEARFSIETYVVPTDAES